MPLAPDAAALAAGLGLRIDHRALANLIPYARNARTHSEAQVALIAGSIREYGFTNPILVDGANGIIAGHGRVLAARKLGLTTVPVIELSHLSETQKRGLVLADNRLAEAAGWDSELLALELGDLRDLGVDVMDFGFETGELDRLLAVTSDADGTAPVIIPEPPRNPASRVGDLWILGDHRLLCGDSTSRDDVRRLMNGERAILFATDPPYLVDYDGSNHPTRNKDWSQSYGVTWDDSSQGAELYDGFIAAAVAEAIAEDAAWYCWHASRRQAMLEACWEKAGAFVHQQSSG